MDFKLCKGCKEMILLNSKAYCSKCQAKYKKEVYESKGMNDPQLIYNKGRYKKARQQCRITLTDCAKFVTTMVFGE